MFAREISAQYAKTGNERLTSDVSSFRPLTLWRHLACFADLSPGTCFRPGARYTLRHRGIDTPALLFHTSPSVFIFSKKAQLWSGFSEVICERNVGESVR